MKKDNEWKDIDVERCNKCGHIVAKSQMQEVRHGTYIGDVVQNKDVSFTEFLCSTCKKNYDYEISGACSSTTYYKRTSPYIQVYENGEEVPMCKDKKCPRGQSIHPITWSRCSGNKND